jgi:hypothetical protein
VGYYNNYYYYDPSSPHVKTECVSICRGAFWSHLNSLCEHEVKTQKNFGYTQVNQIVWPVVIVFKFLRVGWGGGGGLEVGRSITLGLGTTCITNLSKTAIE